jgi:predicted membrane GTPase involved in stress response
LEPIERIYVDVGFDSVSSIMDKIMKRLGTIEDNFNLEGNEKQRIIAKIPSRGLLGLIPEIVNET